MDKLVLNAHKNTDKRGAALANPAIVMDWDESASGF